MASVVSDKLVSLYTPIIARLPEQDLRDIAVAELNLKDEGRMLVRRRKDHHARGGPGVRTSAKKMKELIAPEIGRELMRIYGGSTATD
jgi:hypothetical protein